MKIDPETITVSHTDSRLIDAEKAEADGAQRLDAAIKRLEGLRESTQEMLTAGNAMFHRGETPLNIWRAMFDASSAADDIMLITDFASRMRAEDRS